MRSYSLKGAALVALLSSHCQGFNVLAPKARIASKFSSSGSFPRGFLTPHEPYSYSSKLHSSVADEKETVTEKSSAFDPADEFTGEAPSKILGGKIPYSELTIGVLKETYPGENRVSIAPDSAKMLVDAGFSVVVESGGECDAPFRPLYVVYDVLTDHTILYSFSWRTRILQRCYLRECWVHCSSP